MQSIKLKLRHSFCLQLVLGAIAISIAFLTKATAQETAHYVAMGSSSSAGPNVGIYDPASGTCGRSRSNYAHLLAEKWHLKLNDVSCSGATSHDILYKNASGLAAQIDAVNAATKLVTIAIGANDVHYAANLLGYSQLDTGGNGKVTSDADVKKDFRLLKRDLKTIASEVHRRAPSATIVFVEFLPVLPKDASSCSPVVPLTKKNAMRMRQVYVQLVRTIHAVALKSGNFDVRSSTIGLEHDACSSNPFVTGYNPVLNPTWSSPAPYHPNQAGMEAIAKAIENEVLDKTHLFK